MLLLVKNGEYMSDVLKYVLILRGDGQHFEKLLPE